MSTYPSDLTEREWQVVAPLLPAPAQRGRPRTVSLRRILNGIFYCIRTGCAWRYVPPTYGPWSTLYDYFRRWRKEERWRQIQARLREQVRQKAGRKPTPTAAIIDSQSAKTTEQGGPHGYDGGKKINGRKRHLLVDTMGLVLRVVVHPANIPDRQGSQLLLNGIRAQFPDLAHIWADQGYTGTAKVWAREHEQIDLEVVYPWWRHLKRYLPEVLEARGLTGFQVLPRRWVVERTFAWLGRFRRLSKDYERLPETSETVISLASIRSLLRRLAVS